MFFNVDMIRCGREHSGVLPHADSPSMCLELRSAVFVMHAERFLLIKDSNKIITRGVCRDDWVHGGHGCGIQHYSRGIGH